MTVLCILVTLLLTVCFFPCSFKKLRRSEKAKQLPGPRGLPLVGYLPFLGRNIHKTFMELTKIYGPIYKLSLGRRQCVIISSPELAKEVLCDQDTTFANRNPTIAALAFSFGGKDIAFTPYGPEWRMLRRIFVQEMQSKANLDGFYSLRKNQVQKSVRYVLGKHGVPVDVGMLAFSTVISMITSMFWGGTFEEDRGAGTNAEFRKAVAELLVIWGKPNISDFIPSLARFDLQGIERDMKKASRRIEQIFDSVIEQRMKKNDEKYQETKNKDSNDFLDFLLEFKDENTGKPLSRAQMKAFLADIVLGGTDTTSTAFEWTMAELMLHPGTMKKVQEELMQVVGANEIVEEYHIYKLPYLHAVVKEALRLHPSAPLLLPRSPSQSCTVGGYTIPKGAKVFMNAWAMHRDPQFWNDPFEFQPERFIADHGNNLDYLGKNFHYIPFGSGRRICAGLRLGERMLIYILATFLHMFEWEIPDGEKPDTTEKFGIVLEKSTPLIAIPAPRLNNLELYD